MGLLLYVPKFYELWFTNGLKPDRSFFLCQKRLKIEVKLVLSANMKSYNIPRRLAQQRMTLSELEWPVHGRITAERL